MHALFYLSRPEEASRVSSSDDLPCEPIADALRVEDPSPLVGLAEVLGVEARIEPLRDATCRSFPVWALGFTLTQRIAGMDDDELDRTAERWRKHCATSLDADPYELSECLCELRTAIRGSDAEETLFVLLEERAW